MFLKFDPLSAHFLNFPKNSVLFPGSLQGPRKLWRQLSKILTNWLYPPAAAGNALKRVQRVHAPPDLWDTPFCTRRILTDFFWGLISISFTSYEQPIRISNFCLLTLLVNIGKVKVLNWDKNTSKNASTVESRFKKDFGSGQNLS